MSITKQELIDLINRYPEEIVMKTLGYGYEDFFSYSFSSLERITIDKLERKFKLTIFKKEEEGNDREDNE